MDEKCYNCSVLVYYQRIRGKRPRGVTEDAIRYFNTSNPNTRGRSEVKICAKCWNEYSNARAKNRPPPVDHENTAGPSGVQVSPRSYQDMNQPVSFREKSCLMITHQ